LGILGTKTLATDKAVMQPAGTDNGWTSEIGSAAFEKDGLKGAVILITNTSEAKMANIVILTNTQLYQKEMENFLNNYLFQNLKQIPRN
jgi:coenzyme F420-reducing hydrogenase beta subunit